MPAFQYEKCNIIKLTMVKYIDKSLYIDGKCLENADFFIDHPEFRHSISLPICFVFLSK